MEGISEGDGDIDVTGCSSAEEAKKGDLTFAIDENRLAIAEKSLTSCIFTTKTIRSSTKPLIRVNNPKLSFLIAYNTFHQHESRETFVHPSAVVADSVKIGKNVRINSNVSIEDNVIIGDDTVIESNTVIKQNCVLGSFCHIYPNVTLYENTVLKDVVILHAGVVVGSDGFGYVKDKGNIYKFPQLGKVVIEDNVEVGANTTIDRGSLSDTVIGANTKIDNLCQIAHNVKLGKNVLMAAQGCIAGSTVIGDNVYMSGQVGIVDNVTVGNNVKIGGGSAVIGDIKDDEVVWGVPARPIAQTKKQMAVLSWMTKNFSVLSKVMKEKDI
jgi:UDP-3-O-[3-hydroxymyristoyl] glucosamine N-acyltransferase